ncbi:hypothetical protein [Actinopolyspora mortivallis]|uniref:Uncharacterized protein n=1 Tax=Actinopolyspora mortivallis TaxID=33906 RepID=A0A2T0GT75_ACTMO|nr:hypothetical protein [Actinopolyspora mortivallis]PRW62297.1 hypothetical protein CEP50_16315 [Actinopolyspora mortivallis]
MTTLRLVVLARAVPRLAALLVLMTGLSWTFYHTAITIDLNVSPFAPSHTVPMPEMIAMITGILAATVLRPRLWEWERLGGPRVRLVAVTLAAVAMAAPLLPALIGLYSMPGDRTPTWLVSNTLTIGATVLLLSALIGPLLAGGVTLGCYLGLVLLDNLVVGARPFLPLATYPATHGKWLPPLILIPLALAVHAVTRGTSAWAHNLGRNEN